MEVLSYIINSLRFPNRRDYLKMSAGIRARSQRCRPYWLRHLELCKRFIGTSLGNTSKAIIYGAGGLLDLDSASLDGSLSKLTLVDIDPTLKNRWAKSFPKLRDTQSLDCQIFDVTGVMDNWSQAISHAKVGKVSIEEMSLILRNLKCQPIEHGLAGIDCAISLNLLGQLGVYWRDRVISILSPNPYYFDSPRVLLPSIEEGLKQSINILERGHLELLAKFKKVILLTDLYYYYYKESEAFWQIEDALTFLDKDIRDFFINCAYALISSDSWLWHIAPQKIENPDYGEIHEVRAFCFER
jgi:hypothetical protein